MKARRGLRIIIHRRLRREQFEMMRVAQERQRRKDMFRLDDTLRFAAEFFMRRAEFFMQIFYDGFEGFFHNDT